MTTLAQRQLPWWTGTSGPEWTIGQTGVADSVPAVSVPHAEALVGHPTSNGGEFAARSRGQSRLLLRVQLEAIGIEDVRRLSPGHPRSAITGGAVG